MSKKVICRGDYGSPADFAQAKSVAARREFGYFPSENPKNYVFRRAITDRPYKLNRKMKFFDSLKNSTDLYKSVEFFVAVRSNTPSGSDQSSGPNGVV